MSFNPAIQDGTVYLAGREDLDGSLRFTIDAATGHTEIQKRTSGLWHPAGLDLGAESLCLGENVALEAVGHNLVVESREGNLSFLAHSMFTDGVSISDAKILRAASYNERMVLQPDNTGAWTGQLLEYVLQAPTHIFSNKIYMQTGAVAATEPVRICIWEGTDDTGTLVFDQTYPASVFTADSEIERNQSGMVEYLKGEDYFVRYESDADFSLKMDVTNTAPWLASDVSGVVRDSLLQTKPWVDGDTWAADDYLIQDRKIYVCNTSGQQDGTFAANTALWDVLVGGYADRIVSPDGLKDLILSNSDLTYDDGTRIRLMINGSEAKLKSPDGDNYFRANNTNCSIIVNGSLRAVIGSSTSYVRSSDADRGIWIKQASVALRENGKNRLFIDNLNTGIFSPNLSSYVNVTNTQLDMYHAGNTRIKVDANYTNIYSPDGGNLNIGNAGLAYNGAVVQTSAHKGIVNGIAELDASGIVPVSQLPAYVDAIDEYATLAALQLADPQESNKVYITVDDNKVFRYTGTAGSYAEISSTLVLGTTNTTAYRGDRGLIAYDHSQSPHDYEPADDDIVKAPIGILPVLDGSNLTGIGGSEIQNQLLSPDELSTVVLGDTSFKYYDGNRFRLEINEYVAAMIGPNGVHTLMVDSTGSFYDGVEIATVNDLNPIHNHDAIISPDASGDLIITDTDLRYNDGYTDRLWINDSLAALISRNNGHSIVVGDSGALYDTVEIATLDDIYSHPIGDGSLHVPANSTTNNGKVLTAGATAGSYTWQTPGLGHLPDRIVSPDTLKNVTITDTNLKYADGTTNRIEIDGTQTRFRGVGASAIYMVFRTNSFEINDGVDRFMSNASKSVMAGANDTWWSACYDDRYEVMDDARARIQANATDTTLISPDGGDVLSVANNNFTYNDGTADRLLINAATARLVAQNGAYISAGTNIYINDATRSRLEITSTHSYLFGPSGTKWVDVDGDSIVLQGDTRVTGVLTIRASVLSLDIINAANTGKGTMQWHTAAGVRSGWFGFGSSGNYALAIANEKADNDMILRTTGTGIVYSEKAFRAQGGYQSADGTAGFTGTYNDGIQSTLVIKNGLVVSVF